MPSSGAALVDRLRRDGKEVVAIDLDRGSTAPAAFWACDITDLRQVETPSPADRSTQPSMAAPFPGRR
jgi:nucleoside-diphosphate-sugar epimerase